MAVESSVVESWSSAASEVEVCVSSTDAATVGPAEVETTLLSPELAFALFPLRFIFTKSPRRMSSPLPSYFEARYVSALARDMARPAPWATEKALLRPKELAESRIGDSMSVGVERDPGRGRSV